VLLTPPVLTVAGSNNGIVVLNSPIEFTFADDAQWRSKLTSIAFTTPVDPISERLSSFDKTSPGLLKYLPGFGGFYQLVGTWIWTFKATGYADTTVTVTVQ